MAGSVFDASSLSPGDAGPMPELDTQHAQLSDACVVESSSQRATDVVDERFMGIGMATGSVETEPTGDHDFPTPSSFGFEDIGPPSRSEAEQSLVHEQVAPPTIAPLGEIPNVQGDGYGASEIASPSLNNLGVGDGTNMASPVPLDLSSSLGLTGISSSQPGCNMNLPSSDMRSFDMAGAANTAVFPPLAPGSPGVPVFQDGAAAHFNANGAEVSVAPEEQDIAAQRFSPRSMLEESDGDLNIGRTDWSKLPVTDNPLAKRERYTVIQGRLPDNNPFMVGVFSLGRRFMSNTMQSEFPNGAAPDTPLHERRRLLMKDVEAFNRELQREFKVPIIGGGQLCLYSLAEEVFRLGGLENVVKHRAFRIVGQQLELPRSCTSAAYVLKISYEKLMYQYEQKLVFNAHPENPQRTVDMKSILAESKRREDRRPRSRKANNSSHADAGGVQGSRISKTKTSAAGQRRLQIALANSRFVEVDDRIERRAESSAGLQQPTMLELQSQAPPSNQGNGQDFAGFVPSLGGVPQVQLPVEAVTPQQSEETVRSLPSGSLPPRSWDSLHATGETGSKEVGPHGLNNRVNGVDVLRPPAPESFERGERGPEHSPTRHLLMPGQQLSYAPTQTVLNERLTGAQIHARPRGACAEAISTPRTMQAGDIAQETTGQGVTHRYTAHSGEGTEVRFGVALGSTGPISSAQHDAPDPVPASIPSQSRPGEDNWDITKDLAEFSSQVPERALNAAARLEERICGGDRTIVLEQLPAQGGVRILSTVTFVLARFAESIREGVVQEWLASVARTAAAMLNSIVLNVPNQEYSLKCSMLWTSVTALLSYPQLSDVLRDGLWMSMAVMAPYLARSLEGKSLLMAVALALDCVEKSAVGFSGALWFIGGSVRGCVERGTLKPAVAMRMYSAFASHLNADNREIRSASLTAILHLCAYFPAIAGKTPGLAKALIDMLIDVSTGTSAAAAVYYMCQEFPDAIAGLETRLLKQAERTYAVGLQNESHALLLENITAYASKRLHESTLAYHNTAQDA